MSTEIEYNPFIIKGYFDDMHFCDREYESEKLITYFINQTNVTLFSPRKLGKTGLLNHVLSLCNKKYDCLTLYIDLYATQNLAEFTQSLAKEIFSSLPKKKSLTQRFLDQIGALRPKLSFDPLTGNPELSLDVIPEQKSSENIQNLFQYLDSLGYPVFIAFDEFQQIVNYPEQNTEAILRTILQKLRNCVFLFAGSHATIMNELFNSVKRPFYSSTTAMKLDKIPADKYHEFIKMHFEKRGRTIQDDGIDFILEWTTGYTYPVQYICHQIFATGKRQIDITFVKRVSAQILEEQSHIYLQYRNMLSIAQWNLLKALAKETSVLQPYQQTFIQKYKLGSASSTKRTLEALISKELVLDESTDKGTVYSVYDKLFLRYLQRI